MHEHFESTAREEAQRYVLWHLTLIPARARTHPRIPNIQRYLTPMTRGKVEKWMGMFRDKFQIVCVAACCRVLQRVAVGCGAERYVS